MYKHKFGLCFSGSLTFSDNFMSKNGMIQGGLSLFCGLSNEMNGGKSEFKCKDLEVFQLKWKINKKNVLLL